MWTNRNGIWHTSINKKWTSKYIRPHRKRIGQSKPLESKCCWVQGLSFNDPKIVNQTEMGPASVYSHTWMPDVLRTSESLGPTGMQHFDAMNLDHYFACHFGHRNMSVCLTGTLNDSENMTTNPDSYWTINSKRCLRHRNDTYPSPPSHLLVHHDVRIKMVCLFVG